MGLLLTCESLAYYEDILGDLIPAGAFRFHSHDDLPAEEQCFCAGPVPNDWSEGNVLDRNRVCRDTTIVVRPGFELTLCCRCADTAGVDDDVLAEAGMRVAEEKRQLERAERSTLRGVAA